MRQLGLSSINISLFCWWTTAFEGLRSLQVGLDSLINFVWVRYFWLPQVSPVFSDAVPLMNSLMCTSNEKLCFLNVDGLLSLDTGCAVSYVRYEVEHPCLADLPQSCYCWCLFRRKSLTTKNQNLPVLHPRWSWERSINVKLISQILQKLL